MFYCDLLEIIIETVVHLIEFVLQVIMTNLELTLNSLAEASATELSKKKNPKNIAAHTAVAKQGAHVAKVAKDNLEKQLGHSIVSPQNAKRLQGADSGKKKPLQFR